MLLDLLSFDAVVSLDVTLLVIYSTFLSNSKRSDGVFSPIF